MDALLTDVKPDIAHLHNIYHQLSPSILTSLKRHGVPTVMTLHDYKLVCANGILLSHKGLCEACAGFHFGHAVLNRCIKDSVSKSAVCTIEMWLHTWLRLYEHGVDVFITPSEFLRRRMIDQRGISPERVVHIPNAVDVTKYKPCFENQNYALYYGRLESYKGVFLLLEAMARIPQTQLIIAGAGTAEREMDALIKKRGLRNVKMIGFQTGDALQEVIRGAAAVVVPPICH
jgi:glycosyltransferase involved in cell wall biosynthesis